MKKTEFEEHLKSHKSYCKARGDGCDFFEQMGLVVLHQIDCKFYLEMIKREKQKLMESLLEIKNSFKKTKIEN